MKFRFITTADPEYPQELMLRWEAISKPLGMPPGKEVESEENASFHLIAVERKKLIGCVLFFPDDQMRGRLHQMALSEEWRGKGFGRKMIVTLEHALISRGFKQVYLFAPPDRVAFYTRVGYAQEGEQIKERGVLCQRMHKNLL